MKSLSERMIQLTGVVLCFDVFGAFFLRTQEAFIQLMAGSGVFVIVMSIILLISAKINVEKR